MNTRISRSGSTAQHKGETRKHVLWDPLVYVILWGPYLPPGLAADLAEELVSRCDVRAVAPEKLIFRRVMFSHCGGDIALT